MSEERIPLLEVRNLKKYFVSGSKLTGRKVLAAVDGIDL